MAALRGRRPQVATTELLTKLSLCISPHHIRDFLNDFYSVIQIRRKRLSKLFIINGN